MKCPYCNADAVLVPSKDIYGPGRNYGWFWQCKPCEAYVGCHKGTKKPLGRLADAELRKAKIAAHASFDELWEERMVNRGWSKSRARDWAYHWLSWRMKMAKEDCHIGMMDVEQCRRVVEVCEAAKKLGVLADAP